MGREHLQELEWVRWEQQPWQPWQPRPRVPGLSPRRDPDPFRAIRALALAPPGPLPAPLNADIGQAGGESWEKPPPPLCSCLCAAPGWDARLSERRYRAGGERPGLHRQTPLAFKHKCSLKTLEKRAAASSESQKHSPLALGLLLHLLLALSCALGTRQLR